MRSPIGRRRLLKLGQDRGLSARAACRLIENAIKYGRDDATIEVVMTGDGSQLVIEVRNEGRTIEPSELKRIFEPLRRSIRDERADSANSLGLGWYIARQVVEGHGGEIAAQSNQGRTVFSVRLPQRLDSEMGSQPQLASAIPTTARVSARDPKLAN